MKIMGIEAIYPKPNLSKPENLSRKYPYLLRNLNIDHPNQVWCSDITYIRLNRGFLYLVAVVDWYSRFVLSWRLSNTLDSQFCIDALNDALLKYPHCEIFNTDQGSQFTCQEYHDILNQNNIRISLDGKGRATDNIMVERLWRSLKYEDVYIKNYETVADARENITNYLYFFNFERGHSSFNYQKVGKLYFGDELFEQAKTSHLPPGRRGNDAPSASRYSQHSSASACSPARERSSGHSGGDRQAE